MEEITLSANMITAACTLIGIIAGAGSVYIKFEGRIKKLELGNQHLESKFKKLDVAKGLV